MIHGQRRLSWKRREIAGACFGHACNIRGLQNIAQVDCFKLESCRCKFFIIFYESGDHCLLFLKVSSERFYPLNSKITLKFQKRRFLMKKGVQKNSEFC